MANVIEELLIAVGADISGAIKGIRDVEKAVGGMAAGVAGASDSAGAAIASVGAKGAAGLRGVIDASAKAGHELGQVGKTGAGAFAAMSQALDAFGGKLRTLAAPLIAAFGAQKTVSAFVSQADELGMLSKRLKISVEDIDAWSQANVAAGGSADALRQSLKAYYDATGRPAEEFFKLGEKIEGMTDRQKMAYLRAQGVAWDAIPVFLKGQKEADRLVAKYRKTAFTAEDGERARKFRVAWQDFGRAAQSVGNVLARVVLPPLTALLDLIAKTVAELSQSPVLLAAVGIGLATLFPAKLTAAAGRFVFTITRLHAVLQGLAAVIGKRLIASMGAAARGMAGLVLGAGGAVKTAGGLLGLVKSIGAAILFLVKNPLTVLRAALSAAGLALKAFGASMWAATGPIGLLVAACVGLALALEDIYTFFTGGDSIFGRVLSGILDKDEIESLRDCFKRLKTAVGAIFDAVKPAVVKALFLLMKGFLMVVSAVLTVVADIVGIFVKLCGVIGDAVDLIGKAWDALCGWLDEATKAVGGLWDGIREGFSHFGDWLGSLADFLPDLGAALLDSLTGGLKSAINYLKLAIGSIFDAVNPAIDKALSSITKGFLVVMSAVQTVAADIVGIFGGTVDRIGDAWNALCSWLNDATKAADGFWTGICEGFDQFGDWLGGLIDLLPDLGAALLDSLTDGLKSACDFAAGTFDIIGALIVEKVKKPFKDAFAGVKAFFGFGDDSTSGVRVGDREKEAVIQRFGLNRSNTVNTTASVNVVNNIQTQDNPAAIGQAVGRTLQPAGMRMGNLIGMSTSGVFLKGG